MITISPLIKFQCKAVEATEDILLSGGMTFCDSKVLTMFFLTLVFKMQHEFNELLIN